MRQFNANQNKTITFIARTLIVALVVFFLLQSLVRTEIGHEHFWDKDTVEKVKNVEEEGQLGVVIDQEVEDRVLQLENETHPSPDSSQASTLKSYESLCKKYSTLCSKTTWEDVFSAKQKLYYQTLIIYTFNKLETYGIPALDYVDNVAVRNSSNKSRGYSSRNQIVLDTKIMWSYMEFLYVLTHELGHILDFKYLKWDESLPKSATYTEFGKKMFPIDDASLEFYGYSRINENTRERGSSYKDFVSGYGMTDMFEDFAESVNMYLHYNQIFSELASQSSVLANKYSFLDEVFEGNYINSGLKKAPYFQDYKWDIRPYDTTRF